jgi:Type II secretion system (T2SS), protein N
VIARAFRLPLAWTIDALPLLVGELRLHVAPPATATATPTGEIDLRSGAVAVRAFEVVLPANLVTALAPRAGIRATGDLTMLSPSLDWSASSFAGSAHFSWLDARVAVGNDAGASLGNVDVSLSAAGDRMTGPVTNVGGDLDIRGTVSVDVRGASDVALTLTPRGDNPALARQLAAIAAPDGPGWRVEFRSGQR